MTADSLGPGASQADHLKLILKVSAIGIWELDVVTGAAWRSEQHDRIFGYHHRLPEWTYDIFLEHVLPDDRTAVEQSYGGSLRTGSSWSFECRIRRADGEVRWISVTGRPIKDAKGDTLKLIGHVLDVTHTKHNEEHLRIMIGELNHRVRNTLTVVQAIAVRSFHPHIDIEQGRRDFLGRINTLAAAHSLLTDHNWSGVNLADLVEKSLSPFRRLHEEKKPVQFEIGGPEVYLSAKSAISMMLALNELATNAVKHGSLSVPGGQVELKWLSVPSGSGAGENQETADKMDGPVELLWREHGGPVVKREARTGFGMTLLKRLMPSELNGSVDVTFDPKGLTCRIVFKALQSVVELGATSQRRTNLK